jgi:hypothetical protein
MGAPQLHGEFGQGAEEPVRGNSDARQLAQLADDQVQRHPGEESHEHGF